MTDSKEAPFFNLPPLPQQGPSTGGTGSHEKINQPGKSAESVGKEGKMGSKEPLAVPTKSAPNLGTFKVLIGFTWALFCVCVAGLIYVVVQYKIDRNGLRATV
ncbi:hypothetical protein RB195_003612 [Necator americanus]